MDKAFYTYWRKLKRAIYLELIANIAVKTIAMVLLVLAILYGCGLSVPLEFILLQFFLLTVSFTIYSPIVSLSENLLVRKLHLECDELEYSLHLFFKSQLSSIEQLQKEKVGKKLPPYQALEKFHHWRVDTVFLLSALIAFLCLLNFPLMEQEGSEMVRVERSMAATAPQLAGENVVIPEIGKLIVKVSPPKYTGISAYFLKQGRDQVEEGSSVTFRSSGGNTQHFIVLNAVDTVSLNQQAWLLNQVERVFSYQPFSQLEDTVIMDSVRVVAIKRDQAPQIAIALKENRINRAWDEMEDFVLPMRLSDDYGVNTGHIVATLSKGEGEAVKFRELKWPINALKRGTRSQGLSYQLKIDTLSMAPGDELYFYVTVQDNKYPDPQSTKSDVYFLTIKDTTASQSASYDGLALSVEAEYFKSQRQIIIDTEKLLKERAAMKASDFKRSSNLIGDDQKILRLRYGVFLGEEFATTGGLGEVDHSGHDHGSIPGDETKEAATHEGHDHEQQAASEGNFSNALYNSAEMAAYVHAHDDAEIATFFDAKTKQLLKEALANMWESELYLRTYKPQQALPYEYKALKLIKEVQQASRIYVERIGFEPPPLEPLKKRLSGELSDIDPKAITNEQLAYEKHEQALLSIYEQLNEHPSIKLKEVAPIMEKLGQLLAKEIDRNPLAYGQILGRIAQFKEKPSIQLYEIINMRLENVLPSLISPTHSAEKASLKLNEMFQKTTVN